MHPTLSRLLPLRTNLISPWLAAVQSLPVTLHDVLQVSSHGLLIRTPDIGLRTPPEASITSS